MRRKQTGNRCKLSALMNNQTMSRKCISAAAVVNHVKRVLNLGLVVHYRQVTVAMQEDGGRIKAAGKMRHVDFLHWVQKKLEEGWEGRHSTSSLPLSLLLVHADPDRA